MASPSGYRPEMDPAVNLRPLSQDDAEPVAALVRQAFAAQSVPTDPPASALRLSGVDVIAHLEHGGGGSVATANGEVVASLMWAQQGGGLYISRLAVDTGWRRRGLARALVAEAERVARCADLPRLHLGTRLVLQDNRRLFAACGFAEVAFHCHPGFDRPTWVEMERRLAG
jgi:ribosomal protein S18 acetylase RimI-like enzyme